MSFEFLYRQLFTDLHRYAFTILNDAEWAADVVQDAFLKYYHQLEGGNTISFDKAYLYKIVYNTAISQLRQQKTSFEKSSLINEADIADNNIQDQIIADEKSTMMMKMVNDVLEELPEQCKNVFLKSRQDGKKYREIAEEMGLSIKTVEAHMSKALKIIQEFIRVNRDKLTLIQILVLYELFC